jgi:hypothetical protein
MRLAYAAAVFFTAQGAKNYKRLLESRAIPGADCLVDCGAAGYYSFLNRTHYAA